VEFQNFRPGGGKNPEDFARRPGEIHPKHRAFRKSPGGGKGRKTDAKLSGLARIQGAAGENQNKEKGHTP